MAPASALRGAVFSFLAFSLYALADLTIKFLGSDYSGAQIIFFFGMATFPLILVYMIVTGDTGSLRPVLPKWTAWRCVIVIAQGLLVTYSLSNLPLSQCYAIFFLMPLMISLLAALFLREPIGLACGIAVLAGLVGVLIVVRPGLMPLGIAHLAAFLAMLCGSAYFVIVRKTGGAERTLVMLLWPVLAQTGSAALLMPFVYVPMPVTHIALTAAIACLGFAGTLLVLAAYRHAPAAVVAPMQYGQIIWATLFGVLVFKEPIDLVTLIGLTVIIASGVYLMRASHTSGRTPDPSAKAHPKDAPSPTI